MAFNLYRVILPATDIEKAARFYESVLGVAGVMVSPGRCYFRSDGGGAVLACYDPKADGDAAGAGWRMHENQYVYFAVDDLQKTRNACAAAGATAVTAIEDMPWGETLFYARDPFGNPIAFVTAGTEFTG